MASALPSHLLAAIFSRLPAADFIRSGAVCRSWSQITGEYPLTDEIHFPQIPYLILPGAKNGNLFCPVDQRVSDMPQIHGKKLLGSSDGWLVFIDQVAELHILNPFTGATASLPSITTLSPIEGVERNPDDGRITGYFYRSQRTPDLCDLEFMRNCYFSEVIYFPSVSIAVAIHTCWQRLAFARLGDNSWTELDSLGHSFFDDVIFHKGQLFTVNCLGIVLAYDLGDGSPSSRPLVRSVGPEIQFLADHKHYLVESPDGDLLHVCRDTLLGTTESFKIFRQEGSGRVPVTSLGAKNALFLGHNHSISLSTRDTPLKGNCIYFTEDNHDHYIAEPLEKRDIGAFDLEDESIKPLFPSDSSLARLTWPPPIWIKHAL